MTTNSIKIAKGDKSKKYPKVSQSIPANFYRNYIPPKTPSIRPQAPPSDLPDFDALPKISPTGKGINLSKTGGYSLSSSRHPMSLPTGNRLMDASNKTPFDIKAYRQNHPTIAEEEAGSEQKEASSLEQRKAGLKVGSFTCFEVMNSPLRQLPEIQDNKDAASATSASTFDDKGNKPPSDDDDEEDNEDADNEEDGVFDIEL